MRTSIEEVQEMLKSLPEDSSIEDIQYHLYVLGKIKSGIERADQEGAVPQAVAEERLNKWITK